MRARHQVTGTRLVFEVYETDWTDVIPRTGEFVRYSPGGEVVTMLKGPTMGKVSDFSPEDVGRTVLVKRDGTVIASFSL